MKDGAITDDRRIRAALPSIRSVINRGGFITLMSHLGRPSGNGFEKKFSLKPIANRLAELIGKEVVCSDEDDSSPIILKENLRFNSGEKSGDETFAKHLAKNADIYCNDAFGTAHREHASMVAVPKAMEGKPRVVGLLLAKELKYLDDAVSNATRPFVAVLGGAKVTDKIGAIQYLLNKVDTILVGGAMAYTFLLASGKRVGSSQVDRARVDDARDMLAIASESSTELILPVDHLCAQQLVHGTPVQEVVDIPAGWMGVDIGLKTIEMYTHVLRNAKTIVWNGPMGVFEIEPFDVGTRQIAKAIAQATSNGAVTVVGGGDTAAAVSVLGLEQQMTHISTGGGASIQMLEGKPFSSVLLLDDAV
jgi:phosphoglycerate kinase